MSQDHAPTEDELVPPKNRRYATVGARKADRRHAVMNIPSWDLINEMNKEGASEDDFFGDTTRSAKRSTISVDASSGSFTSPPTELTKSASPPPILPPRATPPPTNIESRLTPPPTSSAPNPSQRATLSSDDASSSTSASQIPPKRTGPSAPISSPTPSSSSSPSTSRTYEDYLAESKTKDFSAIQRAGFAYRSGVDFAGRPVVVICGAVPSFATFEDLFLYIINLMDPITEGDYSVVYVVMSEGRRPSFKWLRKVYGTITRKYKKNLKQLFVVHPSWWVKVGTTFFRAFISSKFWKKMVYINEVHELYKFMSPSQVRFPDYVVQQSGFLKNSNATFGQDLALAMKHSMNDGLHIPYIVSSAIDAVRRNGLESEGIFRISGNQARLKEIQDSYDRGVPVDLALEPDVNTAAAVLKRYLRELPEPIIPFHMYEELTSAANSDALPFDVKCASVQAQLCELQPVNFLVLDQLIQLLSEIAARSDKNKMTPSNLAIVMAPNILYSDTQSNDPIAALSGPTSAISLVTFLISHADTLLGTARLKFEVDNFQQVRHVSSSSPAPPSSTKFTPNAPTTANSTNSSSSSSSSNDKVIASTSKRPARPVSSSWLPSFSLLSSKQAPTPPQPPPTALFGKSLEEAMALPMNVGYLIPVIVQSCIDAIIVNGLCSEGVMRLSGSKARIDELQRRFDSGEAVELIDWEDDIDIVTGLLKRYLSQLPEPIIPTALYQPLINIMAEPSHPLENRVAQLRSILCELSPTQFLIFNHLIQLMAKIASHEAENRMNATSLAIVLAPNVLRSPNPPTDQNQILNEASTIAALITFIIENFDAVLSDARDQASTI